MRTWKRRRAQAMQSSKVVQRSLSSTSTTFSSCSRAAESLDCIATCQPSGNPQNHTTFRTSTAQVLRCDNKEA